MLTDELIVWGILCLLVAVNIIILAYLWGRLDGREQERVANNQQRNRPPASKLVYDLWAEMQKPKWGKAK